MKTTMRKSCEKCGIEFSEDSENMWNRPTVVPGIVYIKIEKNETFNIKEQDGFEFTCPRCGFKWSEKR